MDDGTHFLALSDLDLGGVAINGELLGLKSPNLTIMDDVVKTGYGDLVNQALDYKLTRHGGGGIVHPGLEVMRKQGVGVATKILNKQVLVLGIRNGQRFIRVMLYREFLWQYAPKGLPSWALTGDLPTPP